MFTALVLLSLVHYSLQQCCTPEKWEGMQVSTTTMVAPGGKNLTHTQGTYFLSVDSVNLMIAAVGTFEVSGRKYQVKQIMDYGNGVKYTETDGVCTKEPSGGYNGRCVPANATKVVSSHIGVASLSRNVDIYQVRVGGFTYNMNIGEGCIPISDSYYGTSDNGDNIIGYSGFYSITAGIQDISAFSIPSSCANVQMSGKPNVENNLVGRRSALF